MAAQLASPTLNENIPISRLPSEIFLRICELACPRTTLRSVLDMIALTHVCRYWRDALLSHPIIWSNIYVCRDSSESLVTTMLQRSHGAPLTVNIQYYNDRNTRVLCFCSHQSAWEDGDCCPHTPQRIPSLGFLEPFKAKIHTLNVRYLRSGSSDAAFTEDILKTPFFLEPFPNLESLRWSYFHFDGRPPPIGLPKELFRSSLPRLRELSMVNCWGLVLTDTPVLKMMSIECVGEGHQAEIRGAELVQSLSRRQSLVSLSLTNFRIILSASSRVSMNNLKEIILRDMDNLTAADYIRCPSIGTITTLRISPFLSLPPGPFTQWLWADSWSVKLTATDDSGGSISSSVRLEDDLTLKTTWKDLAIVSPRQVTTLEVGSLHPTVNTAAITNLIHDLPDLCTVRVQLQTVSEGCEVLRDILPSGHHITRVERLVGETESPEETRKMNERWEKSCVEHQIGDLLGRRTTR